MFTVKCIYNYDNIVFIIFLFIGLLGLKYAEASGFRKN